MKQQEIRTAREADAQLDLIRYKSLTIVNHLSLADITNQTLMKHMQREAKSVIDLIKDQHNDSRCWYCQQSGRINVAPGKQGISICYQCAVAGRDIIGRT